MSRAAFLANGHGIAANAKHCYQALFVVQSIFISVVANDISSALAAWTRSPSYLIMSAELTW